MNFKKLNFKLILVILYLIILSIGLYYLFSVIDLKDLNDYEFYKSNQDLVYKFKDKNFIFSVIIFLIGVIIWNLFLGMGTPVAIAGGFMILVVHGPGKISLDHYFNQRRNEID